MTLNEENYLRLQESNSAMDEFKSYEESSAGIMVIPKKDGNGKSSISSHTGDFTKWIKLQNNNIEIQILPHDMKTELRSQEFWLPLVFLANDITLPMYLNIVSSYLYEKAKGSLSADKNRVSLSAIYKNEKTGTYKEFSFKGDADTFQKKFKSIDINKIYDE